MNTELARMCKRWPQRGWCAAYSSHTSLEEMTQIAYKNNIHVVYMHMTRTVNGVLKDFLEKW